MRTTLITRSAQWQKTLAATLLAFGLALPIASVEAAPQKNTSAQKKVTGKKAGHSKKMAKRRSNRQISRSGKQHQKRTSTAALQRQQSLSNLPHRTGPVEIFQVSDAHRSLLLQSHAAVVMDAESGKLLYSKNADRPRPIASITKLMTAIVVLDAHLPMNEYITIQESDVDTLRHSSSRLPVGTTLTRSEAMLLALMSSENRAAAALARTYPGGTSAAVAAMNRKARQLGMNNSQFVDGTGLHSENRATPSDLVLMVKASRNYPEIHQYSTATEHVLIASNGHPIEFRNTNALVRGGGWDIDVSKTGYINEAGRCLVMHANINAKPVVIVLMDSNASVTRTGDANRVKQWLESAFDFSMTTDSSRRTF